MLFVPSERNIVDISANLVIAVHRGRLLCDLNGSWQPLKQERVAELGEPLQRHYLGKYDEQHCFVYFYKGEEPCIAGLQWADLRSLLGLVCDDMFQLAGMALQITRWYRDHAYCGTCGKSTSESEHDRARVCTSCETRFYPRISPCVIGLIRNGERCLLAKGLRSSGDFYSALAGFIDPSDFTAEQALVREVREEVGLEIDNIQYFGSQAWPFPGQLMIAFYADYAGGEIKIDEREILHADWFSFDKLPIIPPPATIAGKLIQGFIEQVKG